MMKSKALAPPVPAGKLNPRIEKRSVWIRFGVEGAGYRGDMDNYFRILSLDGGGSWSLIQAKALMSLFGPNATGHVVLKHFDLVAANSGGSIVAAALAANLPLAETLALFKDERRRHRIFAAIPWYRRNLEASIAGIAPKYDASKKLPALAASFADAARKYPDVVLPQFHTKSLKDVTAMLGGSPRFVICAFDYDTTRVRFFRSNASAASSGDNTTEGTFLEDVNAATNAPVKFFDAPVHVSGRRFWDGAVAGFNNPVLAAVTEALSYTTAAQPIPPARIRALSIGTGGVRLARRGSPATDDALLLPFQPAGDEVADAGKMAMAILDDPPDSATFIAHVLLGHRLPRAGEVVTDGPIVRMSPMIQPSWDGRQFVFPRGLPKPLFATLMNQGMDAVGDDEVERIEQLCDSWLEDLAPNQAIRANGSTLEAEIGHQSFRAAQRAAQSWLASPGVAERPAVAPARDTRTG